MRNAAPEEDVDFRTKVENPEKKKGNGHGETSLSLSILPVLSHWKFLWKPIIYLVSNPIWESRKYFFLFMEI